MGTAQCLAQSRDLRMFVEKMNEHLHSETGPPRSYSSRKAQAPWKEGKLVKVCSLAPVEHSGTHIYKPTSAGAPSCCGSRPACSLTLLWARGPGLPVFLLSTVSAFRRAQVAAHSLGLLRPQWAGFSGSCPLSPALCGPRKRSHASFVASDPSSFCKGPCQSLGCPWASEVTGS